MTLARPTTADIATSGDLTIQGRFLAEDLAAHFEALTSATPLQQAEFMVRYFATALPSWALTASLIVAVAPCHCGGTGYVWVQTGPDDAEREPCDDCDAFELRLAAQAAREAF